MAATIGQLRILLGTLIPFACVVTYIRLYFRFIRGKLWWDDFWAFISTYVDGGNIPQHAQVSVYYMCAQFFYAVVWTVRISMMFTVIRLSIFGRVRQTFFLMVAVFFAVWLILFAQVWWVCERQPGWKDKPSPQCALGLDVAIAQLITDVISDLILIVAPIGLIWRVKLQPGMQVRLRTVFAATAIGTAVSLYHAFCVLRYSGIPEFTAATLQLAVSLIVVNLPVLVAVIFRLKSDDSAQDNVEPFSTVIFAGTRTRKTGDILTTFGAATMPTQFDTKINVRIDQSTKSTWTDSGAEDGSEGSRTVGSDKLELKSFANQEVYPRQD
ncbi:hypothetical protein R3P38DRAFT_3027438 [Favolaschia claudopus]|uniref:Uncharacterized protein n=1 Tax=Favolaschia claudopus TaxID=2862362 RepID=A0AAW0AGF4_9AGAR